MNSRGLLTPREKDAIRDSLCSLCLGAPPFPDGSRCHPHRIVRAKLGGQYTPENVIPLCPPCHHAVDRVALIEAALKGSRKAHAIRTPEQKAAWGHKAGKRRQELYPELSKQWGRELGKRYGPLLTPAQRLEGSKNGHRSRAERQHRDGLTPKELAHMYDMARKSNGAGGRALVAKYSAEERSAIARRREAAKPRDQVMASVLKANRASVERVRREGPTQKHIAHCRAIAQKGNLAMQAKYRAIRESRGMT